MSVSSVALSPSGSRIKHMHVQFKVGNQTLTPETQHAKNRLLVPQTGDLEITSSEPDKPIIGYLYGARSYTLEAKDGAIKLALQDVGQDSYIQVGPAMSRLEEFELVAQ